MDEISLGREKKRKDGPAVQRSQRHLARKIAATFFPVILVGFLCSGCQRAKEPEQKKEIEGLKEEIKQPAPSETKPDLQSKQKEKQITPTQVKKTREEEKKQNPVEVKKVLLTEEEQSQFEVLKNKWLMPDFKEGDALKALKILVKADLDPANLRWYTAHPDNEPGQDICDTLRLSSKAKRSEAFELTLEILKEDRGYVTVCAAKEIRHFNDKKAIPYLRKYLRHTSSNEELTIMLRLEAASSLLALGDADTALPVLDELTKEGATSALGFIYHDMQGKKWEQRGIESIRKALSYDNNESKALAALFWVKLKKEDREYIEKLTLNLLQDILKKERWSGQERRACESAIHTLLEIRSKKSIPVLQLIAKHSDASYIEDRANKAIADLGKERGE